MNRHFRVERDEAGVAWLHLDQAGTSANVLTREVLEEFDEQLIAIAQSHPLGLAILSDKPSGFLAGADVKAFATITERDQAEQLILRAHDIFHRLEALSFPTVALIHGFCLGGGLELALACRYRVAATEPQTRIGFPEVRLGIFPGFGGTVRSVRLLGHLRAMELMLSARNLDAKSARRIGLVDLAVPRRQLKNAARQLISEQPPRHRPPLHQRMAGWAPARPLVARLLRRQVRKRVRLEHYPAPGRLIDHWRRTAGHSADMYHSEAVQVADLLTSRTAQNLIRIFLLQERLKGLAPKKGFRARHVHVVGGGVMGGDIAAWCDLQGVSVTIQDRAPEYLGPAVKRATELFHKQFRDPYLEQRARDRFIPDHRGEGIGRADVVIEAIFEDAEAKRSLYATVEPRLKEGALLATNTSSIPLEVLGRELKDPQRIIGLHFFNPVAKMPLVEIVVTNNTPQALINQGARFARQIGKLPLPVKSSPGFLVNRVLMPYLLEAVILLEEGVKPELVDEAAMAFGMPMGPVELADTVGLDIALSVAEKLQEDLGLEAPKILRQKVERNHLGRKSGRGFYRWEKGKPVKERPDANPDKVAHLGDRLILRLVNEAVACLRETVVADADLLDAGIVFGTGFAPFRGGPLHWVQEEGAGAILNRLEQLEYTYGVRFKPDPGWTDLVQGRDAPPFSTTAND